MEAETIIVDLHRREEAQRAMLRSANVSQARAATKTAGYSGHLSMELPVEIVASAGEDEDRCRECAICLEALQVSLMFQGSGLGVEG